MAVVHPETGVTGLMSAAGMKSALGVNVGFNWVAQPQPYWQRRFEIAGKLRDAGISRLRSSTWAAYNNCPDAHWVVNTPAPPNQDWHGFIRKIATEYGFRFNWLLGTPGAKALTWYGSPDNLVKAVADLHAEYTDSIEAPNEYDIGWPINQDWQQPWQSNLRNYMIAIYRAMRAQPALDRIPYVGPALVYNPNSAQELGDVTTISDTKNLHAYSGNRGPETITRLKAEIAKPFACSGNLPVISTENGESYATVPNGNWPRVTEEVGAWQFAIADLAHRLAGIGATYIYQAHDGGYWSDAEQKVVCPDEHEQRFGLLRYDLSERPSFTYIRRRNALLGSMPKPLTLSPLVHTIANPPADLRKLVTDKGGGRRILWLWREAVWKAAKVPVSIKLGTAQPFRITALLGGGCGVPITGTGADLRVDLGHEPVAIEVGV